jgi:hypothetical protein
MPGAQEGRDAVRTHVAQIVPGEPVQLSSPGMPANLYTSFDEQPRSGPCKDVVQKTLGGALVSGLQIVCQRGALRKEIGNRLAQRAVFALKVLQAFSRARSSAHRTLGGIRNQSAPRRWGSSLAHSPLPVLDRLSRA